MKHIALVGLLILQFFNMTKAQELAEKQIVTGNDTISYYDTESGKAPLFFIHGSFINKEYWAGQIAYFSENYRVVAIDLLGHGKSTHNRNSYTIRNYASDITAVINELHLESVILVGHSIGADIMLEINAMSPGKISGLIAIDFFKNVGFQLPDTVIAQLMADLESNFSTSNEQYARQALLSNNTNSNIISRVVNDFRTVAPKVGISMNEDFFHFPVREMALLSKLEKKLFLINVDYQPTDQTSLSKYVGDYDLHSITGTCHFPMIENPKKFNEILEKAIEQITRI